MDIFSVFALLGGLAFFLYGMTVLSNGLEKLAGGRLETSIKKMTSNRYMSILLGLGVTAVIQSSSAVSVMLVGLVNSGIMVLEQTITIMLGSNIGTTVTAWILSLTGLEGGAWYIKILQPKNFSPIIAIIGIFMIMISKKKRVKDIGTIFVGFAILMYGMESMSGAMKPIGEMDALPNILVMFENPLMGILVGTLFTAVIQSSSASVGILQALCLTGTIQWGIAIPIIVGQNIGTCISSVISSIGTNKKAKRVAFINVMIKVWGAVMFLVIYCIFKFTVGSSLFVKPISVVGVAVVHSVFNILNSLILMPFTKHIEKFAYMVIKDEDKDQENEYAFLDERLFSTPSVAISECKNITVKMSETAKKAILSALDVFKINPEDEEEILEYENQLDHYEDKLGTYLVKLSGEDISEADSKQVSRLLHSIGEFERLGDHAVNLLDTAGEIREKNVEFSTEAKRELSVMVKALDEILTLTMEAFAENNIEKAKLVEPLEQVIDRLSVEIKNRHIERLTHGGCTIEMGFILSDVLNNYERVSDHCSNIAVIMIELEHNALDTHEYLSGVKSMEDKSFNSSYDMYRKKYVL